MAHNLRTNADGKIAFIGHNTNAWHELGTEVPNAMTAEEAIQGAGLDWQVNKEKLYRLGPATPEFPQGQPIEVPAFATVASDTGAWLGTVGNRYVPIQNREAFGFFDQLSLAGEIKFKSAGALGQGERIWILAYNPQSYEFEIVKGDPMEDYILLSNSHDGTTGIEGRNTTITVVCQNTLNAATSGNKPFMKIKHTANASERMKLAADLLAAHAKAMESWKESMQYLAKFPLTDEVLASFEKEMFGDIDKTPEGRGRTILVNQLGQFEELLVKGKGAELRPDTLYKAVQAYTEWADWASPVRGTEDRSNAIVFGNASREKQRAVDVALALAV